MWVLFMIVLTYQGTTVTTAEFSSKESCKAAMEIVQQITEEDKSRYHSVIYMRCARK